MIKLKLLLLAFVMLAGCFVVNAQQQIITGRVTDNSGNPVISASVTVDGEKTGTATDDNGKFSIKTLIGKTLNISALNYQARKITIDATSLNIVLQPSAIMADEVVVVGFGTQKKTTLAGSVAVLKPDVYSDRPITNTSQALSGQLAGVWVNQSSGQPGADGATVRIRGIGTLGNSAALVLVDGVVSTLASVNPNDVESISVLKDGSAAIYGSRAANGVILVQTKSGKQGKVKVEFNTAYGKQKATTFPKMVTNSVQYMRLFNEATLNEANGAAYYDNAIIDEYAKGTDPTIYPNTDWMNVIMGPAPIQTNQLSVSGGENKTRFNVSLGYIDQDGIVLNGNAKIYNFRTNVTTKPTDKLEVGIRSSFRYQTTKESYNGAGTMFYELSRTLPIYTPYTSDGKYGSTWVPSPNTVFRSPLVMVNEGKNDGAGGDLLANAFVNYDIIKGLRFNLTGGITYNTGNNQVFTPEVNVYNPKTLQIASTMNSGGRRTSNTWNNSLYKTLFSSLTYNRTFADDHDVTVAAIYSQEQFDYRNLGGSIMGYVSNSLTELDAGLTTPLANGGTYAWALRSYIGRVNYTYKQKYILEGIGRYDGSSRFSPDNRWGFFPSVMVGWRVTQENFMKNQKIFDELKIRGSWGRSGNDQFGSSDQIVNNYAWIPVIQLARFYPFGSNLATGAAQLDLTNSDIKWEVGTKKNIGFDATLLKNALNVTIDYFSEDRTGIARSINIPDFLGMRGAPVKNLASVSNKGWEFAANYNKKVGEVQISVGGNLTKVNNKITYIPDPSLGFTALIQGQPINAFYMWKATGIFQTQAEVDASPKPSGVTVVPGDLKFEDISGPDGKPDGVINDSDRQVIGSPNPKWTYGMNLGASYKGFDFRVQLQGISGVKSYAGGEMYFPFVNGAGLLESWVGNSWTPTNTGAKLPRLLQYSYSQSQNYSNNSFWLQDGAYMRIKDIQIGYTLPEKLLAKLKLDYLRIYVDAQNAFTFTKFEGLDPERPRTQTSPNQYPNVRVITTGLNIRF